MTTGVLALDQGTTSSKALLIDPVTLSVLGAASRPVAIGSPRLGWVEQDAAELWESVRAAAEQVLVEHPEVELAGIAISNQRESVTAWDRNGLPLGPVVSWQDQRGAELCSRLTSAETIERVQARTGLELTAMYSASKLRWLIDAMGDLSGVRLGTIDAWLLDRLTGGAVYAIEAGNASRTLLFDLAGLDWDDEMCALFEVPRELLPQVRRSAGPWGVTRGVPGIPDGVPILAVLGDSHAALYGHWALAPEHSNTGKATYGTGSSVMLPAQGADARRAGVSTTLAWWLDAPLWAHEANILYSGGGLDWLATLLGVSGGRELSELGAGAGDSGTAVFVPALNGLGAPWWEPAAVGTLTGLAAGTTRAQVAWAGLESVAHQICDVVDVMDPDRQQGTLHAGGGATTSDLLMQLQADLLGRDLLVSTVADISPLGAGALAARGLGILPRPSTPGRRFTPSEDFTVERRAEQRHRWRTALERAGVRPSTSRTAN
ncbi:MAG: FGGY family carbohydrate kinase [Propionicimonas sp.]